MFSILFRFYTNNLRRAIKGCLWIALLLIPCALWAQDKSLRNDTSAVQPRLPNPELIKKLKSDPDYNYSTDPPRSDNLLEKWYYWLLQQFRDFLNSESYNGFWQYVLMAVFAVLVLFLLYKAKILHYVFPPGKENNPLPYSIGKENIHEINFDEAISQAFASGDFRLAIRLQYLKTLKVLTDRNLIQWTPHRTNQSYVQDLNQSPLRSDFEKITRYFEFAWYGAFPIKEKEFEEMKEWSNSFYQKIQRS